MKIHYGYHKEGLCWKWKFDLTRYWKKRELWWFSFWRFYLVLDFVKDWLGDMIGKANQRRIDMMSEAYISEPDKWRKIHIPFTPYYLCRDPELRLWVLAEKELTTEWHDVFPIGDRPIYSYRLL